MRQRGHALRYPSGARAAVGFTLVELLVVIAIIVVLAGILVPVLIDSIGLGTEVECRTQLRQIGLALHKYESDKGSFPRSGGRAFLADLVAGGVIQDVRMLTCKDAEQAQVDRWEVRADRALRAYKPGGKVPHDTISYWGRAGGGRSIRKAKGQRIPSSQIPVACDGLVQDAEGDWISPHGEKVFVLYLDGHVEAIALAEFLAPEWERLGEHPRKVLSK